MPAVLFAAYKKNCKLALPSSRSSKAPRNHLWASAVSSSSVNNELNIGHISAVSQPAQSRYLSAPLLGTCWKTNKEKWVYLNNNNKNVLCVRACWPILTAARRLQQLSAKTIYYCTGVMHKLNTQLSLTPPVGKRNAMRCRERLQVLRIDE